MSRSEPRARGLTAATALTVSLVVAFLGQSEGAEDGGSRMRRVGLPGVFSEDLERFAAWARSPLVELRTAATRGLSSLGHARAEDSLLVLLKDESCDVRREAALGLGRLGGRRAVDALIESLDDEDPWVRCQASRSLTRLTGWELEAAARKDGAVWRKLWDEFLSPGRDEELKEALASVKRRAVALRGLALVAGPRSEEDLLALYRSGSLAGTELGLFYSALERVAGPRSVTVLASGLPRYAAAAWALGNIGGEAAERALLDGLRRAGRPVFSILVNLDRIESDALRPFAPLLLTAFGLVSYRSHPDDVHLDPTPVQRVAARLLLRSDAEGEIVDLILRKLEKRTPEPGARSSDDARAVLTLLDRMGGELEPGFHRADGYAHAQPLGALPHVAVDRALAPRLRALLDHPALVVRVYAGTALARLRVPETAAAIIPILRTGYGFPDAATQVSGKHGPGVSGTVRWKGYLAMALGWDGSDEARRALEELVVDPDVPRDIRFGATIGLGRIADPRSKAALERAAGHDIVRWVREGAEEALRAIALEETARSAASDGESEKQESSLSEKP